MSTNHLPGLSQLVWAAMPHPVEAEKAALREQFITASMALVAEAKCLLDNKEEMWEEKVNWMCQWEQRMGEVYPLIKHGQTLGVNTKIDSMDGPILAEADEAYEKWSTEETAVAVVSQPVQKLLTPESQAIVADHCGEQGQGHTKGHDPTQVNSAQGTLCAVLSEEGHMYWSSGLHVYEAGVQEVDKGCGKEGADWHISCLSKRIIDNEVEVVKKSHVHVDQLTKALEKIGVE
ncbi:hypothetical protein F5J12DRAFT_787539 [Pisolithus orientalis]|uniref:uncharacterized protein n=1 Tax=Pisolithus orientalis TaxID=936130 RepID=UPI002225AB9F|nr:uncharacterized protein F5J12DRAFT_787539 [Pisolithus orientalis]KAI5984697.1 hypothetical protein F5J12DRAFT_787539 [Pisolithus orientalis]